MDKIIEKLKHNWELTLIFIGSIIIRLYNINFLNIWRDESFSINVAKKSVSKIIEITSVDTQPPLHILSLHYWIELFGDSARSVRMLSAFFGVMTVIFGYLIAKNIFKNKRYQLFATALIAFNPLLVFYSQEARAYSMLTAFTTASIYFAIKLQEKQNLKNSLGFIIVSILGLYTHNLFLFVLATIILYWIASEIKLSTFNFQLSKLIKRNKLKFTKYIGSLIVVGISYLPWFLVFTQQFNTVESEGFWLDFKPIQDIFANTVPFFTGNKFDHNFLDFNSITFFIISSLGVPLWILGSIKEIQDKKSFPVLSFFTITMLGIVWLVSFKLPFYYIRYLIFVTPFVLLLSIRGIKELEPILHKKGTLILGIILVGSTLIFQLTNVANNFNAKPDYLGSFEYIEYEDTSDLILHANTLTYHSYEYYDRYPSYIYDPERENQYWQGLAYIDEQDYYDDEIYSDRVYVVYLWENNSLNERLMNENFERIETREFNGGLKVDIWERIEPESVEFA